MKLGIITFHAAYNYGSNLQAYALKTILERNFGETDIINFRPLSQKKLYRLPFKYFDARSILSDLKRLVNNGAIEKEKFKVSEAYEQFISSTLGVKKELNLETELSAYGDGYDAIITGSDQIWNFKATDFSRAYLGEFITDHDKTKLVAYACSMGPSPENLEIASFRSDFEKYKAISVREERTKTALNNAGVNNVEIVLDPTLLLTRQEYDLLINLNNYSPRISTENKAYYYTPGRHDDFGLIASTIAGLHSLQLMADTGYNIFKIPAGSQRVHGGPLEFLANVRDAELIIGASFHLIVFAILYHKPFYCIGGKTDSRMMNLLNLLGLENRVVDPDNIQKLEQSIDWKRVDEKLNVLRNKSLLFLQNSLKSCNKSNKR